MRFIILLALLVCLLHIYAANGGKQFRLGRSRGGNLGSPGRHHHQNDEGSPDAEIPTQWFDQKLDHNNPTDLRQWKQRYFVNDEFYNYEKPGPVFLMVGGEGPVDVRWMRKGSWTDYARTHHALLLNLEHRYYGESHPTKDLSVKSLNYLTSQQALADLAYFIVSMNEKLHLPPDVKWVAFGGSYPGSLAAWLRLKYPHLVYAAIASSGPMLAKVDFMEYYQVLIDAIREKTQEESCIMELKNAIDEIEMLIETNPAVIENVFRLCKPFSKASKKDIKNLFANLADDLGSIAQYNEDNRFTADDKNHITINSMCAILTNDSVNIDDWELRRAPEETISPFLEDCANAPYCRLAKINYLFLKARNETCFDYSYDTMIEELRNVTWGNEGSRQWMYQTCTEFGFYQTSSGEVDVFGNHFDLDFFIGQCQDIFGSKFDKNFVSTQAYWTNIKYGAQNYAGTRVLFVHGSIDPWHALGIIKTTGQNNPAIYIKGTAHCANMYPPRAEDSKELKAARNQIAKILDGWLNLL